MSLNVLGLVDLANLNHVADEINKQRSASINDFRITRNDSSNTWHVVGSGLQRFIQMTNWRYLPHFFLYRLVSTLFFMVPGIFLTW